MLKIHCSDCAKDFIWTDDMPPRGKCPNPDCDGVYDIHDALRKNIAARETAGLKILLCPSCGGRIPSRWTFCSHCGRIVAGNRAFRKRHILTLAAVVLLLITLIIRLWMKF